MMRDIYFAELVMPFFMPEVHNICQYGIMSEPIKSILDLIENNNEQIVEQSIPEIVNVIFNDPATIVYWSDGTKTVVKCQKDKGDVYSKESGLAIAIAKKAFGNNNNFNKVFNQWLED